MEHTYNPTEMLINWRTARRIVSNNDTGERKFDWFFRESNRYDAHPAVRAALKLARPHNWQQLLLEWPHVSVTDASRVAYTRDERAGIDDRQTITTIGKYLRRHWPDARAMPDHVIRDLVQRYGTNAEYKIVRTTAEMLHHLHQGPGSCMVWTKAGVRCADGQTRHPYEVYNPKYGWAMAVGILNGDTISRALVIDRPDAKYYVRTYLKPTGDGYSQVDGGMENWLKEQGFDKRGSWSEGEKFSYFVARDDLPLMPYLDGGYRSVGEGSDDDGNTILIRDNSGRYECNRTDGTPEDQEDEDTFECEDCGDRTDNDDGFWVGFHEDSHVCEHCINNNYTYVYGRRRNQYYVNSDYVVECNGEYYDEDYLDDNNIVRLENGDYEDLEDAIDIDGEWYHCDDERICLPADTDVYALIEDCWQCAASGNWYSPDCEDYTEYEGERYHDDYIPAHIADATADKDDEETTETTTEGE